MTLIVSTPTHQAVLRSCPRPSPPHHPLPSHIPPGTYRQYSETTLWPSLTITVTVDSSSTAQALPARSTAIGVLGALLEGQSSIGTELWPSFNASPVIWPIFMNASKRAGTTNGCLHSRVVSFIMLSSSPRRTRSARRSASESLRACCSRFKSSRKAARVDQCGR